MERIEYPKEGGVLTWFIGERLPEKQLVYPEMFGVLNPFKKVVPSLLRIVKDNTLAKLFVVLMLIVPGAKKLRGMLLKAYTDVFWSGLRFMAFKPEHMCPSAKELRRGLIAVFKDHQDQVMVEQLVDCFALFWEYDNAYRYRGQDVAGIINKEAFLKSPIRESQRVFDEYIKRELEIKGKGRMFKNAAFVLLCVPKYRRLARKIVTELDFEKLKLDTGDRYWCYHRSDYNVDGLDIRKRMWKRHLMRA